MEVRIKKTEEDSLQSKLAEMMDKRKRSSTYSDSDSTGRVSIDSEDWISQSMAADNLNKQLDSGNSNTPIQSHFLDTQTREEFPVGDSDQEDSSYESDAEEVKDFGKEARSFLENLQEGQSSEFLSFSKHDRADRKIQTAFHGLEKLGLSKFSYKTIITDLFEFYYRGDVDRLKVSLNFDHLQELLQHLATDENL